MMQKLGWLWCNCSCLSLGYLTTNERLNKLYEDGVKLFEKELGVEKIIKNLRDVRIYVNQELLDEKKKFKI